MRVFKRLADPDVWEDEAGDEEEVAEHMWGLGIGDGGWEMGDGTGSIGYKRWDTISYDRISDRISDGIGIIGYQMSLISSHIPDPPFNVSSK